MALNPQRPNSNTLFYWVMAAFAVALYFQLFTFTVFSLVVLVGLIVGGYLLVKKYARRSRQPRSVGTRPVVTRPSVRTGTLVEPALSTLDAALIRELEQAWRRAQFDQARQILQKIAYGMVGKRVPQADKDAFKALMTRFAAQDPLYWEVLGVVQPMVSLSPGLVQSKVYPHIPRYDDETIRYVLYFAHELGDIVRVKKGRSYALYPKGWVSAT